MTLELLVVDAFTDRPFAGNPAAVCRLDAWPDDARLADIAREMNLSETAFLVRRGANEWDLRWFTPAVEVDLCGHATLASTHALLTEGLADPATPLRFHTRSGWLQCERVGDWLEMDFPALPPTAAEPPEGLARALGGAAVSAVATSRFDLLVEVDDAAHVRQLRPDHTAVASLGARGVIVTAASDVEGIDCVSRFFAPGAGIPEDPVTGSAHCVLAPYWAGRLGRTELIGHQASARGGIVRMRLLGDRVRLGGQAVTVARTSLLV